MSKKRGKGNSSPANQDHSPEGNRKKRKKRQSDVASEASQPTAINCDIGDFGSASVDPITAGTCAVKVKLPPLVVKSVPLSKLFSDFTSLGVNAEFKLTGIGTKVMLHTKTDFDLVKAFLKDSKEEFFTHDIPGEKPFKAVIRGLPNFDLKAIENELKDRFKLAPLAVYRIKRRYEKRHPDSLFLVHFQKGTVTLSGLQAIRTIGSVVCRWEAYRGGHRDVTQCQRCLNFGHGTRNCNINPRCRICAEDHVTSDCPSSEAEAVNFKCANCGGAHQGSDRQCPKREDFKEIRKQASVNNQPGRKKIKESAPPALTEAQFPALQSRLRQPPPPANNQRSPGAPAMGSQASRTAQQPSPAATSQPNQRSTPASGMSYSQVAAGDAEEDDSLSDEELATVLVEAIIIRRTCKTRAEQIRAIASFITRNGY